MSSDALRWIVGYFEEHGKLGGRTMEARAR